MSNALTLILNGLLQGDLDANGYKILNLDTSNLGLGDFGAQAANTVFAGPESGVDAVPTFRLLTASEVGAQPASVNLTEFALLNPTLVGKNFITLEAPVDTGFVKVGNDLDNTITYRTPVQVRSDIDAQPLSTNLSNLSLLGDPNADRILFWDDSAGGFVYLTVGDNLSITGTTLSAVGGGAPFSDATALVKGSANNLKLFRIEVDGLSTGTRVMTPPDYDFTPASISSEESLVKKKINGLLLAVGTASTDTGSTSIVEAPAQPFVLSLIAVSPQTGTTCVLRTTAPTDIVLPVSGTVATVAGTIPFTYLSVNKDLDGGLASNVKVPTQLAIKTYVDARVGAGVKDTSDATVASATSVDLSVFDSTEDQIEIVGATPIEQFILDEGETKVLVFTDELDLIQGDALDLKGGQDMTVKAGSYVVVKGMDGGAKTEIVFGKDAGNYVQDAYSSIYLNSGGNIGFGNIVDAYFDVGRNSNGADLGSFLRFTEATSINILKHDLSAGVALDISGVTTETREVVFPDTSGIFGIKVDPPSASGDPGEDGMWASDGTYLYAFRGAAWGRVEINYVWP